MPYLNGEFVRPEVVAFEHWEDNASIEVPLEVIPFFNDLLGSSFSERTTIGDVMEAVENALNTGDPLAHYQMTDRIAGLGYDYPEQVVTAVTEHVEAIGAGTGGSSFERNNPEWRQYNMESNGYES